jgi:hypothetical protein
MTAPPTFLRRTSSSQHGGWPLFCRLLLWATRHSRRGEEAAAPAAGREPARPQAAAVSRSRTDEMIAVMVIGRPIK